MERHAFAMEVKKAGWTNTVKAWRNLAGADRISGSERNKKFQHLECGQLGFRLL